MVLAAALVVVSGCGGCTPDRTRALEDLKAEAPDVRAEAVRRLGKVAREEDYLLLAKAAGDPAAAVRLAAVETLGVRRDSRAVDLAAGLLGDPDPAVQEAAAECLGRLPSPKARPYLLESYGRRGPGARAAIARVLAEAGVGPAEPIRTEARHLRERNEAALARGSVAERVGAAEELGRHGTPEAVALLRKLLGDPSAAVAAAAARGLGASGDSSASEDLIPLLRSEHPELREAAAMALGALGDPAATEPLARAAREPTPGAAAAALALTRLPESGSVACREALAARSPGPAGILARHAVAAGVECDPSVLGERFTKGGLEALAALAAGGPLKATGLVSRAVVALEDEASPPELRLAAIGFLGEAGGADGAERLLHHLAKIGPSFAPPPGAAGPGPDARGEVDARDLWQNPAVPGAANPADPRKAPDAAAGDAPDLRTAPQDPRAADASDVRRVPETPDAPVPGTASREARVTQELVATVRALGASRHGPAVLALVPWLADPDAEVREAVVDALGAIGTPEALAAVIRVAREDPAAPVRQRAVEVMGRSRPVPVDLLLEVARGTDPVARNAALRALAEGGQPLPPQAVEEGLRSGLPEVAMALASLGHDEARAPLLAALAAPSVVGRAELVEALGRLDHPDAARAVARELHHDRPEVRVAACRALARLGPDLARETLAALAAEDYYVAVRRAAAEALRQAPADQGL